MWDQIADRQADNRAFREPGISAQQLVRVNDDALLAGKWNTIGVCVKSIRRFGSVVEWCHHTLIDQRGNACP